MNLYAIKDAVQRQMKDDLASSATLDLFDLAGVMAKESLEHAAHGHPPILSWKKPAISINVKFVGGDMSAPNLGEASLGCLMNE